MGRRRLTTPMVISQDDSLKRSGTDLYRAAKRAKYIRKSDAAGSGEIKTAYSNMENGNQSVGTTQAMYLYDIDQGTSHGERLGSKIHAKYIDVRGFCRNLDTTQTAMARLLILQDNKPQLGSVGTNFFVPQSNTNQPVDFVITGDQNQITFPINPNRYRVLSDRKFKLGPNTVTTEGTNLQSISYSVKVDRYIEYLTDAEISLAFKIKPIFYAVFFVELADGTAVTGIVNRDIEFYQHFNG